MSNPVFDRIGKDSRGYATFGDGRGNGRSAAPAQPGWNAPSPSELDAMYGAPAATTADTGRLTYDDVVVKTGLTFTVLLAGAGVGWFSTLNAVEAGRAPVLMIVGAIVGLVLGLVNSFKREPSPVLILAYAAFQGLFIGGISGIFESSYNGIVAQAVLGTLSVFVAVLVGYRSGKLRTSPKLNKIFFIAMMGYLLFSVVNLLLVGFAGQNLRGGMLGLVIGAFAVLLASYSLVMDFEFIQKGVEGGAPAKFAWTAAFGLVVTLVWLYIEILRILSILRGDD